MKRFLCLALVFVFLLFCGCKKNEIDIKTENLNFDFNIEQGGSLFSINAKVYNNENICFTILSPENIKDMSFDFSKSGIKVSFLGLIQEFPANDNSFGMLGKIYKAFTFLGSNKANKNDGVFTVSHTEGEVKYIFSLTDLGIPISLTLNGEKIEFENISFR